jgi:hypothetical protein
MGKVDAAIRATAPAAPRMADVRIALSSGRPVAILVPKDMTARELLDLTAFVAAGLGPELERRRAPRLVAAHALPKA